MLHHRRTVVEVRGANNLMNPNNGMKFGGNLPIEIRMGKDGIIRSIDTGHVEEEDVREGYRKVKELLKTIKDKKFLILDLTNATSLTSKARKVYTEASKDRLFDKVAVIAPSIYLRVMTIFVMRASGAGDYVKIFKNEEEALKWFKE